MKGGCPVTPDSKMGNSFAEEGSVAIEKEEREEAEVVPPGGRLQTRSTSSERVRTWPE
jgi:hypothetical protein